MDLRISRDLEDPRIHGDPGWTKVLYKTGTSTIR